MGVGSSFGAEDRPAGRFKDALMVGDVMCRTGAFSLSLNSGLSADCGKGRTRFNLAILWDISPRIWLFGYFASWSTCRNGKCWFVLTWLGLLLKRQI